MAFSVPCCCCCCLCCSRLTAEQVENASFPLSFDVSSVFRLATLATPHPSPSRHPVLFCHLALFVSAAFTAAFMVFPPYALGHSICHLNMSQFSTFLPVAFNEPTAKVAPLSTPPSPFHFLSRSCLPLDFIMHSIWWLNIFVDVAHNHAQTAKMEFNLILNAPRGKRQVRQAPSEAGGARWGRVLQVRQLNRWVQVSFVSLFRLWYFQLLRQTVENTFVIIFERQPHSSPASL